MYYKSNIELIYLFFSNTKCHNFLFQVNNFIKNNSKKFREFSLPVPIPFRLDWDGTNIGMGRDTGRKLRPKPFSERDTGWGCPNLVPSHEHPYRHGSSFISTSFFFKELMENSNFGKNKMENSNKITFVLYSFLPS